MLVCCIIAGKYLGLPPPPLFSQKLVIMLKVASKMFDYYAVALGSRPILLLFLSLIWGSAFLFSLLLYLSKGDGLLLFGWNAAQTTFFMGGIVLLMLLILCWRIANADAILRKALIQDYEDRYGHRPGPVEMDLFEKPRLTGNFRDKLLAIIRISPYSLLVLTATLLLASVVLKISWEMLSNVPLNRFERFIFVNLPWSISLGVVTVLIYNEISVLDCLVAHFRTDDEEEKGRSQRLLAEFLLSLTTMENECFQKKFIEIQRNKAIAVNLSISESTVKTHVNNMNRKWDRFCQANGLKMTLKDFSKIV